MNNTPTIYTVATAHLDTSWHWPLEKTVEEYLPATLRENFKLFEQYPDYTFSFEGAYRYALIEEYYPELFELLKEYVAQGRWRVAGSSYENGDVNIPSPEALFRNILLGNRYFQEKFGKRSVDIYLPDCFGFGWALPGIAAHANLKGFTTQKMLWGAAAKVPFALGRWQGPDGGEIFACPDAHTYVFSLRRVRKNFPMRRALAFCRRHGLFPAALILHGVGDKGGAPKEHSVATVCKELSLNKTQAVAVRSAGSDDIFRDVYALTAAERARFPGYCGEWLLSDHGTGCYTARVWSKRWNRKAEQLALAAEHASAFACLLGRAEYPKEALNTAWKRVIAHHFHDDMTGTSNEYSYRRNWNDLMASQQQFAGMYTDGVSAIAGAMRVPFAAGRCLAVSNMTQWARRESVAARLPRRLQGSCVRVLDGEGREVPSQLSVDGETVVFCASLPPLSVALYDIQVSSVPCALETGLRAGPYVLENKNMRVKIDENGDIASLYSKILGRECLEFPVRLALFDFDGSPVFPQWELYYPEIKKGPAEYPGAPKVELIEDGVARASVSVTRHARGSTFRQVLSLDAEGEWLRVENELDWQSPRTLLKVEFPLMASNREAAYDLGFGVIKRGGNTARSYEVPAQQWADISDRKQNFGVAVLSDSKTGWDKSNDNTLRLTAVYTPRAARRDRADVLSSEIFANALDFGRSRFAFGLFPHNGDWQNGAPTAGACFNQQLHAFYPAVPQQPQSGEKFLPTILSFGNIHSHIILRALKQSEDNAEEWVARVQEAYGYPLEDGELSFGGGIAACRELYASEESCETDHPARLNNGVLQLRLAPFEIRTLALTIKPIPNDRPKIISTHLELPLKPQVLPGGLFLPDETPLLRCEGQRIALQRIALQQIALPAGQELHLTIASFDGDQEAAFDIDGVVHIRTVFNAREAIGAGDLPGMGLSGYVKDAQPVREFWHLHNAQGGDMIGAQAWFYDIALPLPAGARNVTLPADSSLVILAAYVKSEATAIPASPLFDEMPLREPCTVNFTPQQLATSKRQLKLRMARIGMRSARAAARLRRWVDFRI